MQAGNANLNAPPPDYSYSGPRPPQIAPGAYYIPVHGNPVPQSPGQPYQYPNILQPHPNVNVNAPPMYIPQGGGTPQQLYQHPYYAYQQHQPQPHHQHQHQHQQGGYNQTPAQVYQVPPGYYPPHSPSPLYQVPQYANHNQQAPLPPGVLYANHVPVDPAKNQTPANALYGYATPHGPQPTQHSPQVGVPQHFYMNPNATPTNANAPKHPEHKVPPHWQDFTNLGQFHYPNKPLPKPSQPEPVKVQVPVPTPQATPVIGEFMPKKQGGSHRAPIPVEFRLSVQQPAQPVNPTSQPNANVPENPAANIQQPLKLPIPPSHVHKPLPSPGQAKPITPPVKYTPQATPNQTPPEVNLNPNMIAPNFNPPNPPNQMPNPGSTPASGENQPDLSNKLVRPSGLVETMRILPKPLADDIHQFQLEQFANNYFKQQRRGFFRKAVPVKELLVWSKELQGSLLVSLNEHHVREAMELFRLIQTYMGDRQPASTSRATVERIFGKGLSIPALRDETYCQLCKQTTHNPSM
jgi:hypothetical protein